MIPLLLWACTGAEVAAPGPKADPHRGLSVEAGSWLVGGGALAYEAEPRHHAVDGSRVVFARVDGRVEVWEEGTQTRIVDSACPDAQCPVPRVGIVDGQVAVLRPRVGAGPLLSIGDEASHFDAPEVWKGEPFQWTIPKKWGAGRRPLAVSAQGYWVIPGSDDDVVSISPDRQAIAWSDWQGRVHVGAPGAPASRSWAAPPGGATRLLELAWSPSGDRLVALGGGQAVQVLHPERPNRLSGGAVRGAPRGLVVIDDLHAIGWTSMGIACLQLASLQVVGMWSPGNIRYAELGVGGRTAAVAGDRSGIARIDVGRLCHLQE